MKVALFFVAMFTFPALAEDWKEADYVFANCKGIIEYKLEDKTRVDCLTDEYAFEYDWGYKWAEAIGQSLHYARVTGRKAGIVLILKGQKDEKYLHRTAKIIDAYSLPIHLRYIRTEN